MIFWDPKKWVNPPHERNLGPDFEVRNLFYSPAVRAYLERKDRVKKWSRWESVLRTPSAFQLIINKRLVTDTGDIGA